MGLFDNLFDAYAANRALGRAEAFAGILVAAGACDRHFAREEKQGLFTALRRMKLYAGLADDRLEELTEGLLKLLNRDGLDVFLGRCAAELPPELRDTAFANACDVILADGVVEDEEKAFLDNLQRLLEIDGDTALTIVEVMIIKNKG